MATQNATNTSNPVTVPQGGTGDATLTAYAVLAGGTTSTAAVQSVSGVGTSSQVLVSNGAAALPTWQAAPTGSWTLIRTATASASANITFTSSDITATYTQYVAMLQNITNATGTVVLNLDFSTNNGSTYLGSGYFSGLNSNPYNSTTLTNASSTTTSPLTPSITNTTVPINGILYMFLPASAVLSCNGSLYTTDTTSTFINIVGTNTGTTTINNIRFSYSSGNITSGTISLYGITT